MNKQIVPIRKGLWSNSEPPHLLGSKCPVCSEIYFPQRTICIVCQHHGLDKVELSNRGRLHSYTLIVQRPPLWYKGPVPFALGYVQLEEGVLVESHVEPVDVDALSVGLEMELVIDKLFEDERGNEILCHKFRAVQSVGNVESTT